MGYKKTNRKDNRRGNARFTCATLLVVFVSSLFIEAAQAQPLLPPLNINDATISTVFSSIEQESNYVFLVADDARAELGKTVNVNSGRESIANIMDKVLENTNLSYAVSGNQVTVYRTAQPPVRQMVQTVSVNGTVRDQSGNALAGVSVYLKSNSTVGTVTGANGNYILTNLPAQGVVLVFSYVGMVTQEVTVRSGVSLYNVTLQPSEVALETAEVVSTGIYVRDKVTYTGNIASYTGSELREISSRNVLESLAVLDPSFVMVEDIMAGSNPNSMKNIEIRGQSAASLYAVQDEFSADPNLPLFVLDGVEVPYARIHDLDPNRIESINIAKDAGATAIYGAKGANGVLIIETIKPRAGEYTVSYNGTFDVDTPDLTVFNMMNAREKLAFEILAGRHDGRTDSEMWGTAQLERMRYLNHLLEEINNGVDTYWLSEPLHNGFSNSHSVNVLGGTEELSLSLSANYGRLNGVMKNNYRDRWGAGISVLYRAGKFIISNTTDVSGFNAHESNYGAFSDWVDANPYYRKYNYEGGVDKWLMTTDYFGNLMVDGILITPVEENVPNPLWNAGLRSKNSTENIYINNTFRLQYDINPYMRAAAQFTIRREQEQNTVFKDPDHTDFYDVERLKRGTYNNREKKANYYSGQINFNYGQTLNDVHMLGVNAYVQITEDRAISLTTEAEGYPSGSDGSPNIAHSYKPESAPGYGWRKYRSVGALAAFNYSYDLRYNLDLTFRTDGATTFGSNKLFKPFWSVGFGWNIDREGFASGWNNVEIFKFTATYGTTGNQNIGSVASKSIYEYYVDYNIFGQGAALATLGAPNLPWSQNTKADIRLEFRGWRGRLSLSAGVYHSKTDPLIISVNQIPSTGMTTYPMHMGWLKSRGLEFTFKYSPIYNLEERIIWDIRVNGSWKKSEYGGFDAIMETMNATMRESNTLQQYRDGYSPTAIWAVKSYGIDPATGREIYVKKDGSLTFNYDADDWRVLGDQRPDLEGNITTSFRYKNFMVLAALNYSFGADIYNKALYDKVENIMSSNIDKNQDKRALYGRWVSIGEVAQFRSIRIYNEGDNPITSRFIQKNNFLRGVSFSVNYELNQNLWLEKNLGVKRMTFGFSAEELFRLETSKYERGLNTPFSRMFSLKVGVGF